MISFTEKMLKDAVIRANQYDMKLLPLDSQIDHKFSTEFLQQMHELIRYSKKMGVKRVPIWRRKIVAVLVATLLMLSATAMAVPTAQAQIFEFVHEVYKQFTHIFFNSSENTTDDTEFLPFIPSYIPEDFELVTEDLNGIILLVYEKGDDNISYEQIRTRDVSMNINTEGIELEELEFQGSPAKYYSNHGVQNLIWYDYEYLYTVSTTLDRDAVFKIAESVKLKEN